MLVPAGFGFALYVMSNAENMFHLLILYCELTLYSIVTVLEQIVLFSGSGLGFMFGLKSSGRSSTSYVAYLK